jgi:RNA polymerase sigma-70 factor, ECF subfamily
MDADSYDRDLADRAAAGDDAVFAQLVGRHRGPLVAFVARRTGRATIAEDAVQEALLSAHRALQRGERPDDVKAWLHTIAWRRGLDLLRRESPTAHVGRVEDLRTVDGPDVTVSAAHEFDTMVRHWRGLPHRQRHALAMRVLEGRSHEGIAGAFGVTPEAAKSLVARSRRNLAAAMDTRRPSHARRHRILVALPASMWERLRELATFATANEQPLSLASKVCAAGCAAALAGGGSAAVLLPLHDPPVIEIAERAPERKQAPRRKATPTPTPAAPVVTAVPTAVATAVATQQAWQQQVVVTTGTGATTGAAPMVAEGDRAETLAAE